MLFSRVHMYEGKKSAYISLYMLMGCLLLLLLLLLLLWLYPRNQWLQQSSLWKVLKEMADLSRRSDPATHIRRGPTAPADRVVLTSARSSKLTILLAPLLQGNTKVKPQLRTHFF